MPKDACWLSLTAPGEVPATKDPSSQGAADISTVQEAGLWQGNHVWKPELWTNQQRCIANTGIELEGLIALLKQANQTSDKGLKPAAYVKSTAVCKNKYKDIFMLSLIAVTRARPISSSQYFPFYMFYLETGCHVAQAGLDSLCSPNWPQIPYVVKANLQLILLFSLPYSATPSFYAVLGIKPGCYTYQARILLTDPQLHPMDRVLYTPEWS